MKRQLGPLALFFASTLCLLLLMFPLAYKIGELRAPSVQIGERVDILAPSFLPREPGHLLGRPRFSESGARVAYLLADQDSSARLILWERGIGHREISSALGTWPGSLDISPRGSEIAFLAQVDGLSSGQLSLWREGQGIEVLFPDRFCGKWSVSFFPSGEELLLVPEKIATEERQAAKCRKAEAISVRLPTWSRGSSAGDLIEQDLELREIKSLDQLDTVLELSISGLEQAVRVLGKNGEVLISKRKSSVLTDFDGDGASDFVLYSASAEESFWHVYTSDGLDGFRSGVASGAGSTYTFRLREREGVPVPADYNGDGYLDLASFHPSAQAVDNKGEGVWNIYFSQGAPLRQSTFHFRRKQYYWGAGDARAVPGDFNGDGRADLAVFRKQTGDWQIAFLGPEENLAKAGLNTSGYGAMLNFGLPGDVPLAGDTDGDGADELIVWREANPAQWFIYSINSEKKHQLSLGEVGDVPFVADFDCDSRADLSVYSLKKRSWTVFLASNERITIPWYEPGQAFVVDFNGDACADPAFFEAGGEFPWKILNLRAWNSFRKVTGRRFPSIVKIRWSADKALPVWLWQRHHREQTVND